MGSIPLPALHVDAPVAPPSLLDQYAHMMGIQNEMQMQPLRQQEAQQQIQAQQQENQMRQIQMRDQQAATQAMQQAYANWDGKDYKSLMQSVPQLIAKNGGSANAVNAAQQNWLGVLDKYSTIAKNDAATGQSNIKTLQAKNDIVTGHLSSILSGKDEDMVPYLQSTLAEAQQQGELDPQHIQIGAQLLQGLQSGQITPADARSKIDMFRKSLMANSQMLEEAQKQASVRESNATAGKNEWEMKNGPLTDQNLFELNWMKTHGQPDTPENRLKAQQEYIKETKINPAQVRVEGYAQTREYPVIDTQNGNSLTYASAADINAANKSTPGRFAPAGEGGKALGKTALIEDIRGNLQAVRENLNNANMPEFTADQRAQIAIALNKPQAQDAVSAALRGGVLGSLTSEQQDYLINLAQLKENAMAMRSVLGAGQGSEDLRAAITATIPGPRTPTKEYGAKQLDAFEKVLNRLESGVPNVPLAPNKNQPSNSGGNDPFTQFGGKAH